MLAFLDSNILIYAFSEDGRRTVAERLMEQPFAISVQSLNEFVHVSRRKARRPWQEIERSLVFLVKAADVVVGITIDTQAKAMKVAKRYELATYDAQLVASALEAGCTAFLSEDMHHGLVIDGLLTIRNPFAGD